VKAMENVERLRMDLRESTLRLHEREMQYADIAVNVPEATKPLVDQIEQLRAELASKEDTWSSVEKTLSTKVKDLESQVRQYQRQGTAQQRLLKDGADKLRVLAQEKEELLAQVEEARDRVAGARGQARNPQASAGKAEPDLDEASYRAALSKSEQLQAQLLEEKWKREGLEIEIKKLEKEFERSVRRQAKQMAAETSGRLAETNGSLGDLHALEPDVAAPLPAASGEAADLTSFGNIKNVEGLELVARKLEEDLVAKTRLLNASQKRLVELESGSKDVLAVKAKLAMALELVGEKEEDIEHLHGDLADLKQLYREHIDVKYSG